MKVGNELSLTTNTTCALGLIVMFALCTTYVAAKYAHGLIIEQGTVPCSYGLVYLLKRLS